MSATQQWINWLRRKWRRTNPLRLPWPPGHMGRIVQHPRLGKVFQLRDGCETPPPMYCELNPKAWRLN